MRVRVIIEGKPGWMDVGPGAALSGGYRGSLVVGKSGGEMTRPERAAYARKHRKRQTINDWRNKPPCGVWMPRVGVPCARHAGHSDSHRSAATLEADRLSRRAA